MLLRHTSGRRKKKGQIDDDLPRIIEDFDQNSMRAENAMTRAGKVLLKTPTCAAF